MYAFMEKYEKIFTCYLLISRSDNIFWIVISFLSQKQKTFSLERESKNLKDCLWKHRTSKRMKLGDTLLLSLFICSNVVCKAA